MNLSANSYSSIATTHPAATPPEFVILSMRQVCARHKIRKSIRGFCWLFVLNSQLNCWMHVHPPEFVILSMRQVCASHKIRKSIHFVFLLAFRSQFAIQLLNACPQPRRASAQISSPKYAPGMRQAQNTKIHSFGFLLAFRSQFEIQLLNACLN